MEALLGFHLDFWDYVTFGAIFVIVARGLARRCSFWVFPAALPLRASIPEADAVYLMGWIGFLAVVPWIQALMWAFKPTAVIDIRYLPEEKQHETDAMIAKLTGDAPSPLHRPRRQRPDGSGPP